MTYESLHSQRQKRALNIVWAAAGQYDFWPDFLAFQSNGEPDLYLNSIVGLVCRHYDREKLTAYLHGKLDKSLFGELFTELFWLGLENAAYERELPCRPVLRELRCRHARQFLTESASVDISLQQLMLRQELVHTLKCARCREILTQPSGLLNPWEKGLYQAMVFTGSLSTEELIAAMEEIIRKFFRGHWYNKPRTVIHFYGNSWLLKLLKKFWPQGNEAPEHWQRLLVNEAAVDGPDMSKAFWGGRKVIKGDKELTERYGKPLFSRERRAEIAFRYCQGFHRQVGLWFTGEPGEVCQENRDYYCRYKACFATELRALARRLQNALLLCRRPVKLPARSGRLAVDRLWRGVILHDTRVFAAVEPVLQGDFSVMLLLDGSASREGRQGIIASQAYLMAEALGQVGISLAVVSFFSQDGCTVLHRLKDFGEKSAQGIFAYKTQGWNRDGLALRALPELWQPAGGKRLLFILSDADPSDESAIPGQGLRPQKNYGGELAWDDTRDAVKELRQQGIQVAALINSVLATPLVTAPAQRIYGADYVILQSLSDMAQKVGDMLEKKIYHLSGSS